MSQLSSGGRKTRIKTKKIDKTLVFLISFTILAVIITVICITITLNSNRNGDDSLFDTLSNKGSSETAERIKLGDKVWTNAIETEEVKYSEGDVISEYIFSTEELPHKYEISYEKISGLKNKEVENAINKEIEEEVISCKDKLVEGSGYDRIFITSYISASFSDLLSVQISYSLTDIDNDVPKDDNNYYGNKSLNYRLDTGEKLKFEDLFREDVSIKTILSQALYEAFAWEILYIDENYNYNFNKIDYGFIENQTFKAIAEYNKNPDIDFYFSPMSIYATIRDFTFEISMKKFCSDLALFTKYKGEKLYENSSLQKEFYACTDTYLIDMIEVEGLKSENFYYEIITYQTSTEESDIKTEIEGKINEKLSNYFEISEQNPDKAYMVSVTYYYDDESEKENHYYNYNGYVAELDLDYFRNHRAEIIAKARTIRSGDVGAYDFSEVDDEVQYYEYFYGYTQDYLQEEVSENITTREEKIQQDLEWEQERVKWEAEEEE